LQKKRYRVRIIIPAVIVLTALVVILNIFLSLKFSALNNALIDEKLAANINSLKLYLDNSKANSRMAAVSMALNPNAIKAIRDRNTNELLNLFTPTHDLYRVNFYTICDNEGIVLVRTHEPEHFGDSVLNQQNIKNALTGKTTTYFETGTAVKVSVRTGSPVYDTDGTLIGVISAGIRFDSDSTVKELKRLFNSEVTVFSGNTRIATTITKNGQSIAGSTLDPKIAEIVIENKQGYFGDAEILDEKYKTFYMPLINAHGEAFATFFLGIPKAEIIAVSNKSIRDGIILSLCGLAVSAALLFLIVSSINEPAAKSLGGMDHIADGNLRKLLTAINIMAVEHEKDRSDHSLNIEEFEGDYKTLAQGVLKIASTGMTDQVTGIPNRRHFNNRMNWEWKRAMRDNVPISILIIDIDNFKTYNDSFGHQQGDLVLQMVAKTVAQSIKRSTDFVARWGGDEFIVLLPVTCSTGAGIVSERIRTEIEKVLLPFVKDLSVTASIGVHTQIPTFDKTAEDFISIADRALYLAKESGRNRVVFAETAQ